MGLRNHLAMVVLVEGDLPTLETFSRSLHEDGFDALPAASAEEGLAYFETARPEILVVDLGLADAAGAELIRGLRDPASTPGHGSTPSQRSSPSGPSTLGPDASAKKPLDYDELRGMLQGAVREE